MHSSVSSGHMKVAAKRLAAAVGVSLAVVGALQGTSAVGDDATAVVAVEKKNKNKGRCRRKRVTTTKTQ